MKKKIDTSAPEFAPTIHEAPAPKFTVRGEHNVWHVYKNDERLEPPFRNEQRANTEREHYERSHAIRNERK
jgi:hypothetical protein